MTRFAPWLLLVVVVVVGIALTASLYSRNQQLHEQYGELRARVTDHCGNLTLDLRSAANEYRDGLAVLSSSGSGSDLLRAEIAFDQTVTALGGDSTRSGRAALASGLQRRFLFCSAVRRSSDVRETLRARFGTHNHTFWQSTERAAIAKALSDMSSDAAELAQLPVQ